MYLEVGNVFASLSHGNFVILQSLLFIHLLSWVKTLFSLPLGVQMYLSFPMEVKTKMPTIIFPYVTLEKI